MFQHILKHKKYILIAVVALVILSQFLFKGEHANFSDIKVVETATVKKADIIQTISLIGTIKAKHSTTFIAKTAGALSLVEKAGSKVAKGAIIAKLDNEELEKAYTLSENAEKIAKDQYTREAELFSKAKASSKQFVEEKKHLWINAQKALTAAKIALDQTQFIAPFDGVVGVYKVGHGEQVEASTLIVTLYDPDELVVEFDLPAWTLPFLNDGQKVFIKGETFEIPYIQKMVDPDTHMSVASVPYATNDGIIGTHIDVDLVVQEHKNALTVPHTSVFLYNGKNHVYLFKDDKAEISEVTLGIGQKDVSEILSGVKEGDVVITRGQSRLYPGASVKVA